MRTLFDKSTRVDLNWKDYSEIRFDFMNRSAQPSLCQVRELLESWFSRYPIGEQEELSARFRDKNSEENQRSAFFELFLHEIFIRLGLSVIIHPAASDETKRKPDFLIEYPDGSRFYLEAKVMTGQSKEERRSDAHLDKFFDTLSKLETPDFFIKIGASNWSPNNPIPGSKIRTEVQKWILRQSHSEVKAAIEQTGYESLPTQRFEHEGFSFTISLIPKGNTRGEPGVRPIGIFPSRSWWGDPSVELIKEAVKKKGTRYKTLLYPYIIAIHDESVCCSGESFETALFGETNTASARSISERAFTSTNHGCWTSAGGAVNTRVSGILAIRELYPWAFSPTWMCLYHNPWSSLKLDALPDRVRQAFLTDRGLQYKDGESVDAILGLPLGWPNLG